MTDKEILANYETLKHIRQVQAYLNLFAKKLLERGEIHDNSKLESPELEVYAEATPDLAKLQFGTPEYNKNLEKLGPALEHHYANNRHHPQHFKRGINDMNLIDIVEMFCDWKAASLRHNSGNLRKSIDINAAPDRFNIDPMLVSIFKNSIELVE